MTSPVPASGLSRLLELLDEMCQDALESSLAAVVAERAYSETQQTSALYLEAHDVVVAALDEIERLAEERTWRERLQVSEEREHDARVAAEAEIERLREVLKQIAWPTVDNTLPAGWQPVLPQTIAREALKALEGGCGTL